MFCAAVDVLILNDSFRVMNLQCSLYIFNNYKNLSQIQNYSENQCKFLHFPRTYPHSVGGVDILIKTTSVIAFLSEDFNKKKEFQTCESLREKVNRN